MRMDFHCYGQVCSRMLAGQQSLDQHSSHHGGPELGELGSVAQEVQVVLVQAVLVEGREDLGLVALESCSYLLERLMPTIRHTPRNIALVLCHRCTHHHPAACCQCHKALTPRRNA